MAVLKIQPPRSEVKIKAKDEVRMEVRYSWERSKSTFMQNFRLLTQKLAKLWQLK